MNAPLNILVIEDSHADFMLVERHLKQNGLTAHCNRVDSREGLKEAIERERWDLVFADYTLPKLNFQEILNLNADLPDVPVIMVTGSLGEEKAVELLKQGIRDFVLKDNLARLVPAVERALKEKRELEERRRVEERLELALRGANDGLWDWDLKNNKVFFSPRYKSMLGYADDELKNSYDSWEWLLHPDDFESSLTRLHEFLEGRTPKYESEFRMRHKDGHYVDILSRAFMVNSDQGEALRIVGTHVDITESKKLEQQYLHAQKMEAIGQLAGGLAHDFNNILSAINGFSHLIMLQGEVSDSITNNVKEILAASKRAADLNVSLMALSRRQPVNMAVVDLSEVVTGFESFIRTVIREDIELKISCAVDPMTVMADRGQLEQIIMNLVTNARDAMPGGGKLYIKTSSVIIDREFVEMHGYGAAGEYGMFSVSDSGIGMDEETQTRIFEPFFTTKEVGKGTGLGLSMVYGIVKKHDGFINVYSEPGTGTTFKIYLPRVEAKAQVGKREISAMAPLRGGNETILVGEDDAALRRLSTRILSHYGYRVIEAVDGKDAVDKFIEFGESIRLVLIDLVMPNKNGKQACDEMKKRRPDLKVIFTSGYTRDTIDEYSIVDEYTDFIHKPISPNDLVAKVREMLDKGGSV
jgi:PAS domain S-box-containing protein